MLRRLSPLASSFACLALSAAPALVAAPAHAADVPDRDDWALGGSLSIALPELGLGGLGVLGGVGGTTVSSLIVERRVSDAWWLTFGLGASYRSSDDASRTTGVAGTLGVRWVVDPDARVRIAPTARVVAGGSWRHQSLGSGDERITTDQDSRDVALELGLDVELAVTRGFGLRLAATLAAFGLGDRSVQSNDADLTASDTSTVAFDFGLAPSIAAIWLF